MRFLVLSVLVGLLVKVSTLVAYLEEDENVMILTKKNEYKLSLGLKDENRLDLLNAIYNPASNKFLSTVFSQYKGNVLELGCGTGIISRIIAEKIYPYKVVATDISRKQIQVAKGKGSIPANLEFYVANARDVLSQGKLYDIIYVRFVLVHLNQLHDVLALIKTSLTKNGIIIIEDVSSADSQYVEGDNILTRILLDIDRAQWQELFPKEKIAECLDQLGFEIVKEESFHPELKTSEERKLLTWGLESAKDSLITMKLVSEEDIDEAIDSAKKLELDHARKVFYYKMFQLVMQKK